MPTIYLNGSSPNYAGFEFSTAIELINQMETTLILAGWASISKVSGTSLFVKATTSVNNHNCWMEFVVSGTTPSLNLTMRGWLEQAKTNGSPNAIHTATFIEGSTNRLWLSADNEAGCFCIFNGSSGASSGYHFGFLDRFDVSDQWAWMVGNINSTGYGQAYSAKSAFNGTTWRLLANDYKNASNYANTSNVGGLTIPVSTFDFMRRGTPPTNENSTAGYPSTFSNQNPFLLAYNGGRNYNNRAIIDPYCYLEGRGSVTNYAIPQLYFRGNVKFAYCGVSSESAVSQIVDPVSGNRILSVGGTTWQGMRIF